MMFFIGGFIAIACLGGGGLICVAMGSLAWESRERRRRLEEIYLSAVVWNRTLDLAFQQNDPLLQAHCLEYLEALCEDALYLYQCHDDGSEEADIVRDLVYCGRTPVETSMALAKCRRQEVY